jgi:hypothetical protein
MVPSGSVSVSLTVFPVETMLQPASTSDSAMALPMPRIAPVIKAVRPFRLVVSSLGWLHKTNPYMQEFVTVEAEFDEKTHIGRLTRTVPTR